MRIGKIMIRDPITVPPETTVLEAIKIMQELNIRHLPVVRAGQFAGWLSARDLYGVMLAAMLEEITETKREPLNWWGCPATRR